MNLSLSMQYHPQPYDLLHLGYLGGCNRLVSNCGQLFHQISQLAIDTSHPKVVIVDQLYKLAGFTWLHFFFAALERALLSLLALLAR